MSHSLFPVAQGPLRYSLLFWVAEIQLLVAKVYVLHEGRQLFVSPCRWVFGRLRANERLGWQSPAKVPILPRQVILEASLSLPGLPKQLDGGQGDARRRPQSSRVA